MVQFHSYQRDTHRGARSAAFEADEQIEMDERSKLSPAEMVDKKLIALLGTRSSGIRSQGPRRPTLGS
jgi:hypothetical protein